MIDAAERAKMLRIPLCGVRVVERLASVGIERLIDLRGQDAVDLMERVNIEAGRAIWRPPMATRALSKLIAAAEHNADPAETSSGTP